MSRELQEAWRAQLGTPVPLDMLQSGNIDPYAVTGTPAIDAMTGMLYVDSLLLVNGTITHSVSIHEARSRAQNFIYCHAGPMTKQLL